MIAYLVHTGVSSNRGIGWMLVTGSGDAGCHPNTGVKVSHPSHMFRMRRNKSRATLLGPSMLKVGTSGDCGICVCVHVSKVGDKKVVSKRDSEFNKLRCRVQIGC